MTNDRIYSVNEVNAALGQLHGRTVRIACVLHLEHEGDSIWHIPGNERLPGYESSLWADFGADCIFAPTNPLESFNNRRVVVTGTINKEEKGHFGLWPGAVIIRGIAKYGATSMVQSGSSNE